MTYTDFRRTADLAVHHARLRHRDSAGIPLTPMMLEVAFFASLAREERVGLTCSLVVLDPDNPEPIPPPIRTEHRWVCTAFESRLPLTVANLSKLASAADPWSTSIAIYRSPEGEEFIWGLVDQQVHYNRWKYLDSDFGTPGPKTYRITIEDSAHISVHYDFTPLVRIIRDQVLLAAQPVFRFGPVANKLGHVVTSILMEVRQAVGAETYDEAPWWPDRLGNRVVETLQRVLLHIQKYHHGGALLIAARENNALRPKYVVEYSRLRSALVKSCIALIQEDATRTKVHWRTPIAQDDYWEHYGNVQLIDGAGLEIDGAVQFLASLSRVDGLVWLDDTLTLRGFGVEIAVTDDPPLLSLAGDVYGTPEHLTTGSPNRYGMRHRSMMRYCFHDAASLGFVISQDGPVRAMTRVDNTLLYWDDASIRGF